MHEPFPPYPVLFSSSSAGSCRFFPHTSTPHRMAISRRRGGKVPTACTRYTYIEKYYRNGGGGSATLLHRPSNEHCPNAGTPETERKLYYPRLRILKAVSKYNTIIGATILRCRRSLEVSANMRCEAHQAKEATWCWSSNQTGVRGVSCSLPTGLAPSPGSGQDGWLAFPAVRTAEADFFRVVQSVCEGNVCGVVAFSLVFLPSTESGHCVER